jgi:triphosphoribosyl-dephospho-CoA synthase
VHPATNTPCFPRGWSAETACRLEATAPKPGNVHPAAEFPDLRYDELVAAGRAIAPAIDLAWERPLGETILEAVKASRAVTRSNANLGIVLAIAPLAAVGDGEDAAHGIERVLGSLTADDARHVWQAIAVARPGGLGTAASHDLAGPPPRDLLAAMREAAGRDGIARLWATGYRELFDEVVPDLEREYASRGRIDDAIVLSYLQLLARRPDTLVARKHGDAEARRVSAMAAATLEGDECGLAGRIDAFDRSLRTPPHRNPGTSADFLAAALYILLREGRL